MHSQPDQDTIDRYLVRMRSRMGSLSTAQQDEACDEVRQHLETMIAEFQAQGTGASAAVDKALRQFGNPFKIGRKMAAAWPKEARSWKVSRWDLISWAWIIIWWQMSQTVLHVNMLAVVVFFLLQGILSKPCKTVLAFLQRRLNTYGSDVDLASLLDWYRRGMTSDDGTLILNPPYYVIAAVVAAVIWLLPIQDFWKHAFYAWWSFHTVVPPVIWGTYRVVNRTLKKAK
jgi:hypothetical protein